MKHIVVGIINFYQVFLSFDHGILSIMAPGGACRYEVSCSEYTKRMILKHGLIKGLILGGKRIISCR